ncbi:GNAT family N-acetyltransferase [Sinomonas sp. ASV322]|uniref:GNAT family N-acetyltransferase n=1 Tax=Sinomonas sp. ASV322 TaxID=3041920 RepID=UPI0027DD826B|nr:GNAT family N-acetyltransferase [Sinomonas sp. ASV322]MDQ4501400.1 GNAT family N-acetyltransferase [Sinomonas sp. ASV322]
MAGGLTRIAAPGEAVVVAELLDAFNREFGSETPGIRVLAARLVGLLSGADVFAVLVGEPAAGVALVTLRPNVWFEGRVALLDELYVVPSHRGSGLGSLLLAAVEAEVRRRGGELVEINVDGEDVDARRFYERHGYSNRDPGQEEPQLYYAKELAGS